MLSKDKTVKKKNVKINKSQLWNIFEKEVEKPKETLECIFRSCGDREKCDACEYGLAFSEEGFLTCMNPKCGIIYKDILDNSAEWRYYGADDNQKSDPTRCGMLINPYLEESSYGCKVLCNGSSSYESRKIRRYTEWQSMPYKEKTQYEEFETITDYARNAGIPKRLIDDAIKYHKKISEYDLTFRGDNRDGVIAASLHISFWINNYPRTPKELATIFHLDPASATKGCKNAMKILNKIEQDMDNEEKTKFKKISPMAFIERYCSKLNINNELTKVCEFVSKQIEKMHESSDNSKPFASNTPQSIAAGIVYFISQVCNLNITRNEVAHVSEISQVTIGKCFNKLEPLKEKLIPQVIVKKYNMAMC